MGMGMNPMMMMMMMNGMNNNNNMGMNNMGMNNMGMNNMGMNNMGMNNMMNFGNDDWMKGFEMGMKEDNEQQQQIQEEPGPKINVVFKTTQGTVTNMVFKHGMTVGQALEMYLKRVGRPDLINNLQGRLCFLVNAKNLKFTDNTKIEDFFKNVTLPTVLVNDVNNLIGA